MNYLRANQGPVFYRIVLSYCLIPYCYNETVTKQRGYPDGLAVFGTPRCGKIEALPLRHSHDPTALLRQRTCPSFHLLFSFSTTFALFEEYAADTAALLVGLRNMYSATPAQVVPLLHTFAARLSPHGLGLMSVTLRHR
eukprot:3498001-Pyramimonas_sp.AAC.1